MILLTGAINDKNKETVFNETVLVWIEPTANMDLPMVNELRNEIIEIDNDGLVIWTNHPEIINAIPFRELWRVEDGILLKKTWDEVMEIIKVSRKKTTLNIAEYVLRNWIFS